MILNHVRLCVLSVVLPVAVMVGPKSTHACACCTSEGQRYVGVEKLDAGRREEIGRLRFTTEAQLFTGEADPEAIKGIATPSSRYQVKVTQASGRFVFDFRDQKGRSGTLILAIPSKISIFEVDPRQGERAGGHGPVLYKEWTLTSKAAGTGIFAAGIGTDSRITLVLHGQGNSCTSSIDFGHWTIVVSGAKGKYELFGELVM